LGWAGGGTGAEPRGARRGASRVRARVRRQRSRARPTPARGLSAGGAARVPDARRLGVAARGGAEMATGGRGGTAVRALVPESFGFCRAPSSAAIASTARVDQRVMCREIRSNLTSPPPPPQLGLTRRATRRRVASSCRIGASARVMARVVRIVFTTKIMLSPIRGTRHADTASRQDSGVCPVSLDVTGHARVSAPAHVYSRLLARKRQKTLSGQSFTPPGVRVSCLCTRSGD